MSQGTTTLGDAQYSLGCAFYTVGPVPGTSEAAKPNLPEGRQGLACRLDNMAGQSGQYKGEVELAESDVDRAVTAINDSAMAIARFATEAQSGLDCDLLFYGDGTVALGQDLEAGRCSVHLTGSR
jgi:hypothetical protein